MSAVLKFFRRLLCRHRRPMTWVRNIYGDEIIEWGYKRSLWRCHDCGGLVPRDSLEAQQ